MIFYPKERSNFGLNSKIEFFFSFFPKIGLACRKVEVPVIAIFRKFSDRGPPGKIIFLESSLKGLSTI